MVAVTRDSAGGRDSPPVETFKGRILHSGPYDVSVVYLDIPLMGAGVRASQAHGCKDIRGCTMLFGPSRRLFPVTLTPSQEAIA